MNGLIENLKNPEINQETVLKLFREKGYYNGFAWLGVKEINGVVDSTPQGAILTETVVTYYMVIYKHLFSGNIFGTPIRVTKSPQGIGYATLVDNTANLTDLK
jgi:hypothetical protein